MVYLSQIDASIQQDIRYAGQYNFLGRRVAGYLAGACILTKPTARALRGIQSLLRRRNLSLKVYDCYRPARAVRDFMAWARDRDDVSTKAEFYPTLAKRRLFARHYISRRSKHTRGHTVDLTIVPLGSTQPAYDLRRPMKACHLPKSRRAPDNSIEFGTGYDCFHYKSGSGLERLHRTAWRHRRLLNRLMRGAGFHGYTREWWHFTLRGAGTGRAMDFVIRAADGE